MRAYRRVTHTAWRRIEDETIIADLRRKRVFALNAGGGLAWEALAIARSTEDQETATFVAELEALGLVESVEAGAEAARIELPAGAGPRVVWGEEMRLFAASCGFQPLVCDDSPQSNAPAGMTAPPPGVSTGPGDPGLPWLSPPSSPFEQPPVPDGPTGGPDDPASR